MPAIIRASVSVHVILARRAEYGLQVGNIISST